MINQIGDPDWNEGANRIFIPNNTVQTFNMKKGNSVLLLGDAFVETSRSQKKIIRTLNRNLIERPHSNSHDISRYVLDWHESQELNKDDQTLMVLKSAA